MEILLAVQILLALALIAAAIGAISSLIDLICLKKELVMFEERHLFLSQLKMRKEICDSYDKMF
jgi:hypothetical protein